jgi:hypothetical protein
MSVGLVVSIGTADEEPSMNMVSLPRGRRSDRRIAALRRQPKGAHGSREAVFRHRRRIPGITLGIRLRTCQHAQG